jgi:predicted dehydrogenase
MHVATYRSLPDVEVVAISDSRLERLEEVGEKYHVTGRHHDSADSARAETLN